jgi:hypothetical protein
MATQKTKADQEQLLKNLTSLSDTIHIYAGTVALRTEDEEIKKYMGLIRTCTNHMLTEMLVFLSLRPTPNNREELVRKIQAKLKRAGKERSDAEVAARLNDLYFADSYSTANPPDIPDEEINAIVENWL